MGKAASKSAVERFNEVCTIRIELRGTKPLIWRRIEVPTSVTLNVLNDIVQIVMGWFDCHLWEFTIGDRKYGVPTDEDWGIEPPVDAAKVRLRDVLQPKKTIIDYVYDFGDNWKHRLAVTDVRQGEPGVSYPRYAGGAWRGPPEDSGGIHGFYKKLEILGDPKHLEHAEIAGWLDGYDPAEIDVLPIGYALGRIASRRTAARVRLGKGKA